MYQPNSFKEEWYRRSITLGPVPEVHPENPSLIFFGQKSNDLIKKIQWDLDMGQGRRLDQSTRLAGFPSRKATMLLTVTCILRSKASSVLKAMCGVRTTFFILSNGLPSPMGSLSKTSSPAPAI